METVSHRNPGKNPHPLPPEKIFERPPRAQYCSDRAQTSTIVSGRPFSAEPLAFAQTARVQRDMVENRREFHNYNYTYSDTFIDSSFTTAPT